MELSQQIHRHKKFEDAEWTIPSTILVTFEDLLSSLRPKSRALRNAWLFEAHPDKYFDHDGSYDERQKAVDKARREAIDEVIEKGGFAEIAILARRRHPTP